ncbi:MAG: IS5 family transposase [Steroidobacteraceae bacterium]
MAATFAAFFPFFLGNTGAPAPRTGAPWRDLPEHFGRWNSVYQRFARWSRSRVWQAVFMELSKDSEFAGRVYLDSTIVRAHQHAAGLEKNGPQALGRSRGGLTSKIHALVEGMGQLMRFAITGGEIHDITQAMFPVRHRLHRAV